MKKKMHKMPDGHMMSDADMKKMMGGSKGSEGTKAPAKKKKTKKAPPKY